LNDVKRRKHATPVKVPEADPVESAKSAGLRYVSDEKPGIARKRKGKAGFAYFNVGGKKVADPDTLLRIRQLAIPPAWEQVWISPDERGHIQAVGRDQRGRKQYRYHPKWREARDATKYEKMMAFVHALPNIRARVKRDLGRPGLSRDRVLATVVRLLETTLIRIGNDEYASSNNSFGLTTLRDRHAKINGSKVRFHFKGKSGVEHEVDLNDPQLAKIVRKCQELPGEELLQYVDESGTVRDIGSGDVNDYLREITGQEFTAKDFRTWAGTVLAATALKEFEVVDSKARMKKNIVVAIESVAKRLGNTRAVCKKCYIHPAVLESYVDGSLLDTLGQRARKLDKRLGKLRPEEAAVLVLLQRRLVRESTTRRTGSSGAKRRAA
jgi:DNA topoisomerase-1